MSNLQPPLMVTMCIYYRNNSNQEVYQSYIGAPVLVPDKENNVKMVCMEPNTAYQGWYPAERFYAINPMFTPIPSYFRLICAKRNLSGEKNYNTLSVVTNYDPFNINDECIYFLTWTLPTPYTTPLYVYKSGGGILVSFKKRNLPTAFLSPLFVLTEKPKENTILPGPKKWFNKMKNGTPDFLFRNDNGRCIPEPGGISLEECTLQTNLQMQRPLSLLDILKKESLAEKQVSNIYKIPNFFKKTNNFVITVVITILFITLGIVIYLIINK